MHQNLILILDGARFAHSTYGLSLELIVGNFHGFQRVRSDQLRREQECQNGHWRTDEELKVRPQCLPKRNSNETKWSIHGYTLQNKTTVLKNPEKWRSETVLGERLSLSFRVQQLAPAPPPFASSFQPVQAPAPSKKLPLSTSLGDFMVEDTLPKTCQAITDGRRLTTIFPVRNREGDCCLGYYLYTCYHLNS